MQTIGERLEEARKKKGISIREAAEATKIRGDYLQKFETNQFDIGLTEIYVRGFLRTYCAFLKMPVDRVMSDYAALGRGDVRPRQPNREIYGRMDITVASASESADRAAPPEEAPAAEPAPARQQPRYPRGTGSSLPSGPDPAIMYKWIKIGGAVLVVLILILIIKMAFSGNGSGANPRPTTTAPAATSYTPPTPQTAREPSLTLIATNPVHVRVQRKNPDDTYGEIVFDGPLARGESRAVPWQGPLYITATSAENLTIDVNGRRISLADATRQTGYATGQLPAPPR
jgi:transcriptional regulator with XRE-family HTH domain